MTRKEYIQMVRESNLFNSVELFLDKYNSQFPKLLEIVACLLFIKKDIKSDFAVETRRRLIQLLESGTTDG